MRAFELTLPTSPPPTVEGDAGGTGPGGAEPTAALCVELPEELYIPRVLQRDGLAGYEPSTLACFLALIERHGGPVLDVGANVGVFSLVGAAVLGADITAFEPVPELAAAMRTVAERNGLSIPIEESALGADDTEATFYLSDVTDSSNSLLAGFRPSERSLTVRVERLDSYTQRTGIVPSILKVDTEATEPDVLAGGLATLREHRPYVICEVLARRSESALEQVLADLDYHWYQITEERTLVPRREIFGDRAYRFNNWLFAPEPPDDEFWRRMLAWREALGTCTPVIVTPEPSASEGATSAAEPPPAEGSTPAETPTDADHDPDASADQPTDGPLVRWRRRNEFRKRGVYGRKKLLAGILAGVAIGAVADRFVTARRR